MDPPTKSWSIHTRSEITAKYEVLEHIGSGSFSDVYRGKRLSDGETVALKEVHDHQSASREIEALKLLRGSENVVIMHEFFWREDEDAVLVLEFLRTDLAAVIREAAGGGDGDGDGGDGGVMGIAVGEVKRWMIQALNAVHVCHMNKIVHRDLKPGNFLISDDGVLKLADFGQARILTMEPGFDASNRESSPQLSDSTPLSDSDNTNQIGFGNLEEGAMNHDEYFRVLDELKIKSHAYDTDKDTNTYDGNNSCLATCRTSDIDDDDDDPWKGSFTYEAAEEGGNEIGPLTSCVGTLWFRAPELLYGSTNYGMEVDLWSLGCIFAELLALKPLFPGTADIDQISRIISVLGNLNEEAWSGCSNLPDYAIISFTNVEKPTGLEACMPNCSDDEVSLVKRLICYDPAKRATAIELLHDKYFGEEPLPVSVSQLWVPFGNGQSGDSVGRFRGKNETGSEF